MTIDLIVNIIQLYGFPAVMCIWFMLRLEKRLDQIETTNHRQVVVMAVLTGILGDRKALGTITENYLEAITEIPKSETNGQKELERKTL